MDRLNDERGLTDEQKIGEAYRLLFDGRRRRTEVRLGLEFLQGGAILAAVRAGAADVERIQLGELRTI